MQLKLSCQSVADPHVTMLSEHHLTTPVGIGWSCSGFCIFSWFHMLNFLHVQHMFRDGSREEVKLRHLGAADGNTVIAKNVR